MKLRFKIDQAEAFRRGIDAPRSFVTIEVDPAGLDQETRALIADRMDGIVVRQLNPDFGAGEYLPMIPFGEGAVWIVAVGPTFGALMDAIHDDERRGER